MEQLRKLLRLILGVNATSFKEAQAKELAEVLVKQEVQLGTYVSDVNKSVEAKFALISKLADAMAKEEATIRELQEK